MTRHSQPLSFTLLLIAHIYSVLLFTSIIPFVEAAPYSPNTTFGSSSVHIDGKAWYILGGESPHQHFMVDLSVSWNASNPSSMKLPDGPYEGETNPSGVLQPNGEGWFVLLGGNYYQYSFKNASWSKKGDHGPLFTGLSATKGATDPESGAIYFPFGDVRDGTKMMMFDSKSWTAEFLPQVLDTIPITLDIYFYAAWNVPLKSMIYMGNGEAYNMSQIFAYNPYSSYGGWRTLTGSARGTVPSPRHGACVIPYGDSKVVHFGGAEDMDTIGDIHVLDLTTLTWEKGTDLPIDNSRAWASCAVSNGYFMAWGGVHRSGFTVSPAKVDMIIYDLKRNTWTSKYVAPLLTPTTESTGPTITLTTPVATSNMSTPLQKSASMGKAGIILVACLGALVLIIVVMCRARSKKTRNNTGIMEETEHSLDNDQESARGREESFGQHTSGQSPHAIIEERLSLHPQAIMEGLNPRSTVIVTNRRAHAGKLPIHPQAAGRQSRRNRRGILKAIYRDQPVVRHDPHGQHDTMALDDLL